MSNVDSSPIRYNISPFDYTNHSTENYRFTLSEISKVYPCSKINFYLEQLISDIEYLLIHQDLTNAIIILQRISILFNNGRTEPVIMFRDLANKVATKYREILKVQRITRKRSADDYKKFLCKLSYFLNEYIDTFSASVNMRFVENVLDISDLKNPWDISFFDRDKFALIDSSKECNLKICDNSRNINMQYTVTMPTWLANNGVDIYGGSSYSNDYFFVDCESLSLSNYQGHCNVTGIATEGSEYRFFSFDGKIFKSPNKVLPMKPIHSVSDFFIDKIYKHENTIFLISFTSEGYILRFDGNAVSAIPLEKMISCNGICIKDHKIYAIDKMQGYLFEYDMNGKLMNQYLGFGQSSNKLMDPIAIVPSSKGLVIVNWINAKIAEYV